MASNSAGRLAGIQGIDSKKAIQLSEVSKLYLSEKDMVYLTESVKTSLKSSKYRIIDCGGKLKYYFGDVDSIALRKLETEDGKSILLVNLIRFFDLKMPLKVSKNKVRPSIKDDKLDSYVKKVINANIFKLQRAEREILDDLLSGGAIFQLLQERWRFSLRRTFLNKGLFLHRKDNIFRIRSTMITIPGNKVSSSENGLVFPYHKESNSYIVHYSNLANLLGYLDAKADFIETNSGKDLSFPKYKKGSSSVKSLFVACLLMFCVLPLLNMVYLGLIGGLIFWWAFLLTYNNFRKLKKRVVKFATTPYYKRQINLGKLEYFFGVSGATTQFKDQFIYEQKSLDDIL